MVRDGGDLPELTDGERESLNALRQYPITENEMAMFLTIARLTGKRLGEVGLTWLTARDQIIAAFPPVVLYQSVEDPPGSGYFVARLT